MSAQNWRTVVASNSQSFLRAAALPGVVAAVGDNKLVAMREDGGGWLTLEPPMDGNLNGVAFQGGTLLVSGDHDVYRYTGSGWVGVGCVRALSDFLFDLAATDDGLWVVGGNGGLYRSSDAGCAVAFSSDAGLTAVAATSGSRVWAVGAGGAVVTAEADGGWRSLKVGTADLRDVALSSSHAYALADDGTVSALDTGATRGPTPACNRALAVVESDAGDVVYAVGGYDYDPQLCIYPPQGGKTQLPIPSDRGVYALRSDGQRLWFFGGAASVLSYPVR
jgi:hypothetical protein